MAALVPLLVRIDLRRLQRWLEPRRPAVASPADPRSVVEAAGRHVQWVVLRGWPLVRPGCLTRGISGYYLLRRAGLDVALCFGVDSSVDPGRSGHCWLALDGHPILQAVDPRSAYLEVARLSSAGVAGADRR